MNTIGWLSAEVASGIERSAAAMGGVAALLGNTKVEPSAALIRRQVVRSVGGGREAVLGLLLGGESNQPGLREFDTELRACESSAESASHLVAAVERAGLASAIRPTTSALLLQAFESEGRLPTTIRAALVAGSFIAGAPGSRAAVAAATLCAEAMLIAGGITHQPWAAPSALDAATRTAAVQLERAGDWQEWIRAWCMLAAREAATTARLLDAATRRMTSEREATRAQHRVGATDDAVLARLHATSTLTIRDSVAPLDLSAPTIGTSIERLEAMGFAIELTGQSRDRVWTSSALVDLALAG